MALAALTERRTTADVVFDHLYDQIISLGLLPGARISETEIAEQFGVSRQPVREAFNRLGNLELLLIQPQKATLVQKFSLEGIRAARFIRLAVELETARAATARWSDAHRDRFLANLDAQDAAVAGADARAFHDLDEAFHGLIAEAAEAPFAFDLIVRKKALIDRICVLSLKQPDEMAVLVGDHRRIFEAIATGDREELESALRVHLTRIEKTIDAVRETHAEYFDP